MAGTRARQSKQTRGKSLIGRITPNDRNRIAKKPETKRGFTVVNGKLVSADDVGVLLRQATSRVESRKLSQVKNSRGPRNNSPKNGLKQKDDLSNRNSKPQKGEKNKIRKWSTLKEERQLVISTNSDVSDRVLLFKNLALGVNQESLKAVLQQLSSARISRVRVKDLPSGSATANVWLSNPNIQELERVRKLFDGALVDGRTIQVATVTESSQKLSY